MDIKGFRDDINEQFVCRLVTAECFSRIHGWWCWDLRCRAPAKLLPRSDTPLCLTLPSDRWSPCVLPPSLPPLPCPWRPLPVCRETALRESWDEQDVQLYDSTKERILEMIQVLLWNYAFYFIFFTDGMYTQHVNTVQPGNLEDKSKQNEPGMRHKAVALVAVVTSVCWVFTCPVWSCYTFFLSCEWKQL